MIRRADARDIETIYLLGSLLHDNFRKTNHLEEMLLNEIYKIFVYENIGVLIGFLMVVELSDTVDIQDIFVDVNYRRRRVASSLISYLLSDINETVSLITLEVSVDNISAVEMYEKFGFEVIHKRLFYYGNKDAFLMGRKIER